MSLTVSYMDDQLSNIEKASLGRGNTKGSWVKLEVLK